MILSRLKRLVGTSVKVLCARYVHWTKPLSSSLPLGTFADLGRSKSELIAENALLRQQLIILKRQVKRPVCTNRDRIFLVLLARAVRVWKQALFLVQPETLLRWHREAFRYHRTQDTPSGSCRRYPIPDRRLGGATASGSHSLWASTEVPHL